MNSPASYKSKQAWKSKRFPLDFIIAGSLMERAAHLQDSSFHFRYPNQSCPNLDSPSQVGQRLGSSVGLAPENLEIKISHHIHCSWVYSNTFSPMTLKCMFCLFSSQSIFRQLCFPFILSLTTSHTEIRVTFQPASSSSYIVTSGRWSTSCVTSNLSPQIPSPSSPRPKGFGTISILGVSSFIIYFFFFTRSGYQYTNVLMLCVA